MDNEIKGRSIAEVHKLISQKIAANLEAEAEGKVLEIVQRHIQMWLFRVYM